MARSHRRTPIVSITTAVSEKQDRRWASRIHRSATRRAGKRDTDPDATVLPILHEVSDEWAMAEDGRSWFGPRSPELMRKQAATRHDRIKGAAYGPGVGHPRPLHAFTGLDGIALFIVMAGPHG